MHALRIKQRLPTRQLLYRQQENKSYLYQTVCQHKTTDDSITGIMHQDHNLEATAFISPFKAKLSESSQSPGPSSSYPVSCHFFSQGAAVLSLHLAGKLQLM